MGHPQNPSNHTSCAYALLVGINDFSTIDMFYRIKGGRATLDGDNKLTIHGDPDIRYMFDDLFYPHSSIELMKEILRMQVSPNYSDYDQSHYTTLLDSHARYLNVVNGLMSLAAKAKVGDVVTLCFSTHGIIMQNYPFPLVKDSSETQERFQAVALYDELFTEAELYVLLRLFKKGVRIYAVFDCCKSGKWLHFDTWEYGYVYSTVKGMKDKIAYTQGPNLANYFELAYNQYKAAPLSLSATICIIGGIAKELSMIDSFSSTKIMNWAYKRHHGKELNMSQLKDYYEMEIYNTLMKDYGSQDSFWKFLYKHYRDALSTIIPKTQIPIKAPVDYREHPALVRAVVSYWGLRVNYLGKDTELFEKTPVFGLF